MVNTLRILVLSDSHGCMSNLLHAFEHEPTARYAFFLGDGISQAKDVFALYSQKIICKAVAGNCDFGSDYPDFDTIAVEGVKIYFTHGHKYYVKLGFSRLIFEAQGLGAKLVLFGHTHEQYYEYNDGLHVLNPGSIREGRYAVADITPAGIVCVGKRLPF